MSAVTKTRAKNPGNRKATVNGKCRKVCVCAYAASTLSRNNCSSFLSGLLQLRVLSRSPSSATAREVVSVPSLCMCGASVYETHHKFVHLFFHICTSVRLYVLSSPYHKITKVQPWCTMVQSWYTMVPHGWNHG